MKKSQILAALALAFALGVVAPVANTVVSSETYAVEARALETATKQEVTDAIAKVEGYATYKNFAAIFDALDYYENEDVMDNDTETIKDSAATLVTLKGAISTAVTALGGNVSNAATLETAIATAKKTETAQKYTAYKNLYDLVNADNKDTNLASLKAAVTAIDGEKATANAIADKSVEEVKDYVKNEWGLNATYTKYVAMIDAVVNAETYNAFADRLELALNNVQDWKKTSGKTAVDTAASDETDPVAKLVALAADANIEGFTEYQALYNYINGSASEDATNNESTTNQSIITEINNKLKAASLAVPGDQVSLDDLKVPAGTGEGTNKPSEDDDKKDPSAPDTGILADAEANASTTVAMVAGIATALTAAGAGVVAYRNARRSTRK